MKKILLSFLGAGIGFGAFAQLPVSTTPENKNVILEEFTGIYCTFCPDGHVRAEQIRSANPNDVFLINVHAGSYANPNGNDPDFRTPFGDAIAGQSQLAGYPAGTINRRNFPGNVQQGSPANATAQSRGTWASTAPTVLGETSYVNVALEADIDVATRVMTVDLEAYFTSAAPASVNINVAVTQNNVQGPQTGAASYNPGNILANGNYNHGHMLRHMITGQWGEVVTTTSTGTTVTKQYIWNIPADINGVPVELGDLQVIGFIVEGQQNIVTGSEGPVSFTVPPGTILVDLETEDATTLPTGYCEGQVEPKVIVSNTETGACSGYEVSYSIDGGTPVTETITAALAGGASATHTFPMASLSGGYHSITFDVELTGSAELEIVSGNNGSSSPEFLTVEVSPLASIDEGFESTPSFDAPVDAYVNSDLSYSVVVNKDNVGATENVGGYAESDQSYFFFFWSSGNGGKTGELFFDKVDLVNKGFAAITMDYAYTSFNGSDDKLEVLVSTDCGSTWESVWMKSGEDLRTADEVNDGANGGWFKPAADEWETDVISLNDYLGEEVMVKFKGVCAANRGDNLYLDNVNISTAPVGVSDLFTTETMSAYPNPAKSNTTLKLDSQEAINVSVNVYDLVGKKVISLNDQALSIGTNNIELNTDELQNGVYMVEVSSSERSSVLRLVIQK